MMKSSHKLAVGAVLLSAIAALAAVWRVGQPAATPASMAAMLPQGALLTIESPDFAALLRDWNASPEQKAWLASENYSVFSNSRLFGRLNDAREEFEAAAKASPNADASFDGDFLKQVAGQRSIFAWYDVGNLEFLYITHVSAAQAGNIALLKQRAGWSARQAGGITFYMRKSATGDAEAAAESAQGKARTVAFAQTGDLLLLATREDLMANALTSMHAAPDAQTVANEPWYSEASAAQPVGANGAPVLHMMLNLERIVPLPYFRSYWVQGNVTQMKQYRAAVSDLYRQPGEFREQRTLLPVAQATEMDEADLGSLAGLAPAAGVYRATATHDAGLAVNAIAEKLLGRMQMGAMPAREAPDPSLEVAQSGSANDLETRTDAPTPVTPAASNEALAEALRSGGLDAVLTWSSAQPPATASGLWVPVHSVVALHGTAAWNAQTLATALQQSLRGSLSVSTLGVEFRAESAGGQTVYGLTGPKPLFFATSGGLCLLADDRATLRAMLAAHAAGPAAAAPAAQATQLAGFDHASQRAPFARLTALIDGTNQAQAAGGDAHVVPAYFSGNLKSLSDSFAGLAGERFSETRDGAVVRQTVTYQWNTR